MLRPDFPNFKASSNLIISQQVICFHFEVCSRLISKTYPVQDCASYKALECFPQVIANKGIAVLFLDFNIGVIKCGKDALDFCLAATIILSHEDFMD